MSLQGKNILITGGAVRLGRHLAISLAQTGANIMLHYGNSKAQAEDTANEITKSGGKVWLLQADLANLDEAAALPARAREFGQIFAIIHNAAIFEPIRLPDVTVDNWQRHLNINLSAPLFISQAFFTGLAPGETGRIVTMLDWRSLRPGIDHLPYTTSKAALAALTCSLASAMAPQVTVNGIALGAILPPADGANLDKIIQPVPMKRWADLDELSATALFLLDGPRYITGEIIHLDGGRHLI
jgi:NAD(P)-dependent dehydrogenase (short-subunit alcohol dehydrogenase family)